MWNSLNWNHITTKNVIYPHECYLLSSIAIKKYFILITYANHAALYLLLIEALAFFNNTSKNMNIMKEYSVDLHID